MKLIDRLVQSYTRIDEARVKDNHRWNANDELATMNFIYKDFKKSTFDTYATELSLIYHDIKYAKRNIYKWSKIKRVGTNLLNFPAKSYIVPEPL